MFSKVTIAFFVIAMIGLVYSAPAEVESKLTESKPIEKSSDLEKAESAYGGYPYSGYPYGGYPYSYGYSYSYPYSYGYSGYPYVKSVYSYPPYSPYYYPKYYSYYH